MTLLNDQFQLLLSKPSIKLYFSPYVYHVDAKFYVNIMSFNYCQIQFFLFSRVLKCIIEHAHFLDEMIPSPIILIFNQHSGHTWGKI